MNKDLERILLLNARDNDCSDMAMGITASETEELANLTRRLSNTLDMGDVSISPKEYNYVNYKQEQVNDMFIQVTRSYKKK